MKLFKITAKQTPRRTMTWYT
ncbi:hypothetical protein MAR_003747 [Mya arenaria]|uniref:Uncharacterized protein n=1 Tax=Mya arenaria TaxID=6604 RepID=A0ABY7G9G1_MYAAR|nr:hypothetical protein MAR_003747 [Mya arenaria]